MTSSRRNILIAIAILVVVTAGWWVRRRWTSRPKTDISSVVFLPAKVSGPAEFSYLTDTVPASLSVLLTQVPLLDTRLPPSSRELDAYHGNVSHVVELYGVQAFVVPAITVDSDRLVQMG